MITGAQGLGEDSDVTEVLESLDAHTAVVRWRLCRVRV